jgi:hypothetical protein
MSPAVVCRIACGPSVDVADGFDVCGAVAVEVVWQATGRLNDTRISTVRISIQLS